MNHEEEETIESQKPAGALVAILFLGIVLLASAAKEDLAALMPAVFPNPNVQVIKENDSLPSPPRQPLPPAPDLSAHAFLVRFVGDNQPLLHQRESKSLAPASITKLLTVLIAFERLDATDVVPITENAKSIGEKQSGVLAGERFTRDQAIRLALISSANDAAYALAEVTARREGALSWPEAIARFVDLMNSRASALGMASSFFKNPAGLDEQGHRTTALDISRMAEYIWGNASDLFAFSRERETTLTSFEGREHHARNTNPLLKEFPALRGTKTGLTDEAGGTLVMLYPVRPDKIAVIVILGSEDRFGDGKKIIEWLEKIGNGQQAGGK